MVVVPVMWKNAERVDFARLEHFRKSKQLEGPLERRMPYLGKHGSAVSNRM